MTEKVLGLRCSFCKKELSSLLKGRKYCSEVCAERCNLKTALYWVKHPDKVKQFRDTQRERRKLPEVKAREAIWQKQYHLKNRLKRIKMQKVRYETSKKVIKTKCCFGGSTENLKTHHSSYDNYNDFFVSCEVCHRKHHRKYDYNSPESIRGGLIALSKM